MLHEIINQNEIINNSVTTDRNNKSKETRTESSANVEKENQELKTLNQKLHKDNQYLKGYLRYKTITSQNVPSKAQIMNFFIS